MRRLFFLVAVVGLALFGLAGSAWATAPGDLDLSFGPGGTVTTAVTAYSEQGAAVAVQSDGKIVVVGDTRASGGAFAIARYTPGGALDTAFGTSGTVVTRVGTGQAIANSVAIQPDGKIVVAGFASNGSDDDFAVARYLGDGSLDTSFGDGGIVLMAIGSQTDEAAAVALQADGKIVVAGFTSSPTQVCVHDECSYRPHEDFAVVRFLADGQVDGTFNNSGIAITDFGSDADRADAVALDQNGSIVVSGYSVSSGSYAFAVARYTSAGILDASFGAGGKVVTSVGSYDDVATTVAVGAGNSVLVGGYSDSSGGHDFALVRYTSGGLLDPSFGSGGEVTTSFGAYEDDLLAVALQSDGRIVAAGTSFLGYTSSKFALARYEANGSLDTSFGAAGILTTAIGSGQSGARGIALQSDGKIVLAGYASRPSSSNDFQFALARYAVAAPGFVDSDGDGVADGIDPPNSSPGSFADGSGTSGSIVDRGGLAVQVEDAPAPDGVHIVVGPGTGQATFSVCGGFTLKLAAGSDSVVTCGSIRVRVAAGTAQVALGGGSTTVTIPAGVDAKVAANADGSYAVTNYGGGTVSVTVDGTQTEVPAGTATAVRTWHFVGFTQPVDNLPVLNVAKAGSAIPLKWRLVDSANQPVTTLSSASISVRSLSCTTGTTLDQIEELAPGGSGLTNLGNGYYQLNWKTPSAYAGSCKTLLLDLGEGITRNAAFKFTR